MFSNSVLSTYRLGEIPGFLSGFSRVLDVSATSLIFKTSDTPEEADEKAILSDWEVVGDDIRTAVKRYEQEQK